MQLTVKEEDKEVVIVGGSDEKPNAQAAMEDFDFEKFPAINYGVNMKGDAWCCHSPSRDCYHYLNRDGSIYFKNPDKSSYYWDPRGYSRFTDPQGREFIYHEPRPDAGLNRFYFFCPEDLARLLRY